MSFPADLARSIEAVDAPPGGGDETLVGYGAGQMFASGHVFNLRRFTATTLEAAYTSVWHRDPDGTWTFYQDAPPSQACPRYFGARIAASHRVPVELDWTGPQELVVRAADIEWTMRMRATAATRVMNAMVSLTPRRLLEREAVLRRVEQLVPALGLGHVSLVGTTPNGQHFRVAGQDVWKVHDGRATVAGADVGPPGVLAEQPRLGEYWVPRDFFAATEAHFEALDSSRHLTQVSQQQGSGPAD